MEEKQTRYSRSIVPLTITFTRLASVLGLTESRNPNTIEQDLMCIVPRKEWMNITYLLIEYGRNYCPARKHRHDQCSLNTIR